MSLKEIKAAQISVLKENAADKETRIQILNTWINELNTDAPKVDRLAI